MTRLELENGIALAKAEALKALKDGETPIGAVVLSPKGDPIGFGHNTTEADRNPLSHAEINAIESALSDGQRIPLGSAIVITLEPCLMCLGAILNVGIDDAYYLAQSPESGAFQKHGFQGKIREHYLPDKETEKLLKDFFSSLRGKDGK